MPINPYLRGEIYSIHPIQPGKLALFLKKPENRKKGIMKTEVTAETVFASEIILPSNRPSEFPEKAIKKLTK